MVYFDKVRETICGLPTADILIQHDSELFYHFQRNVLQQMVQPFERMVKFREDEKFSHMDHVQIAALLERLIRYFFTGMI
jgi:hypothetical protein